MTPVKNIQLDTLLNVTSLQNFQLILCNIEIG